MQAVILALKSVFNFTSKPGSNLVLLIDSKSPPQHSHRHDI